MYKNVSGIALCYSNKCACITALGRGRGGMCG